MDDFDPDEFEAEHALLRRDPRQYLALMDEKIRANPNDHTLYFSKHHAWRDLGQPEKALEELTKSIELKGHVISYISRGTILNELGRYEEARTDFESAQNLDPQMFIDCWGPLHYADCLSHLGRHAEAQQVAETLPRDFRSPGMFGAPHGNKKQVLEELKRRSSII